METVKNDVSPQDMYSDDVQKLRFMKAMHSIAGVAVPAVVAAFDLSRFKTVCDIGGECMARITQPQTQRTTVPRLGSQIRPWI